MNKRKFYKLAEDNKPAEIPGHYAYQLPALLALAGIGTAGGALLNKKKRLEGALFGGLSLPALYLAYLYGQKNIGWDGNAFDRFVNKNINNPVHAWLNPYTDNNSAPITANTANMRYDRKPNKKVRAYKLDDKDTSKKEDMGYVPNWLGSPIFLTIDPKTNKYVVIPKEKIEVDLAPGADTASEQYETAPGSEEVEEKVKNGLTSTIVPEGDTLPLPGAQQ